jgi:serine/threonine protein kinase
LSSILPVSAELNMILRRIFECDPHKRITLQELRELIINCPRLTINSYNTLPPSPPQSPYHYVDPMDCANMALPPSPPASPSPQHPFQNHPSEWSLFEPASKSGSSCSSVSTDSGYESEAPFADALHPPVFNFYGNVIPLNDTEKPYYCPPNFVPAVAAF